MILKRQNDFFCDVPPPLVDEHAFQSTGDYVMAVVGRLGNLDNDGVLAVLGDIRIGGTGPNAADRPDLDQPR